MDQLDKSKRKIKRLLLTGREFTSSQLNLAAATVDSRKSISRLRNEENLPISDRWETKDGRRWKWYFISKDDLLKLNIN